MDSGFCCKTDWNDKSSLKLFDENKTTGIRKLNVPKIAKEVGQILARYAVPASIREKVFDYVRADYDFHAVIPYVQSKGEQD